LFGCFHQLPGRGKQFLQYAPVAQKILVCFADIFAVNALQVIVVGIAAGIITEFFIRTAVDAAVAAKAGFCFCDHVVELMAVTDGAQNNVRMNNIEAY
jgi:hypothetical protein